MAGERRLRILGLLEAGQDGDAGTTQLCRVAAEVTGASGAGIMLMSGDLPQGSVCASDDVSDRIEELQYTLGEGPCVDAYQGGEPVLEPDLTAPSAARWLAFTPETLELGARAMFGFPLQVGAVRLGALNLYRREPGSLVPEQHADALVVADIAAQMVLAMQAGAPAGAVQTDLAAGGDFHFTVHQAAGMVSVQAGVGITAALIRLRARAYGTERLLRDVASDVVERRLRFDATGDA